VRIAAGVPQLSEAAGEVRSLARALLAQGVAAEQLTQMTSALNDGIAQRLIALASEKHPLRGEWCWLALGSEGRLEQTLATDQDNALIVSDGSVRQAFLAFADEVNQGLAAAGFPLCKGEIMARNPKWCLTLEEWRALFSGWIRNPQPEALLNASIFFDFRALAGEARLAGALRTSVLHEASGNNAFRRAMAGNALQSRPPEDPLLPFLSQAETLDLKGSGVRPFVDGARLLALAHGLPATSTAARLRGAADAGALPQAEAAAFVDAFHFIQMLRLRRQYLESNVAPGTENLVSTGRLNAIDQRILKEAFRQASTLQQRLQMDYAV
jgi:CBS domain-containing protein